MRREDIGCLEKCSIEKLRALTLVNDETVRNTSRFRTSTQEC